MRTNDVGDGGDDGDDGDDNNEYNDNHNNKTTSSIEYKSFLYQSQNSFELIQILLWSS